MSDKDFLLTPFATCAGTLDKDTEKFIKNDITDVAKCCLNFCEPQITFCNNRCKTQLKKIFKNQIKNPSIKQKIGWSQLDLVQCWASIGLGVHNLAQESVAKPGLGIPSR